MSTLKTNNIQHVDLADPSILLNSDGSVSIAGTVSYEDATNVDSVGIITGRLLVNAQKQIHVGTGVSVKAGGLNVTAGITTVQALQATTGTFTGDVSIADKIVHTGDTNTAIRFSGADTISFETGGTERLSIESNGTFAFGNVTPGGNPAAKNVFLCIGDSDSGIVQDGDGQIEIFANDAEVVNFNAVDGATFTGDIRIPDKIIHSGDTDTAVRFPSANTVSVETGGSERARITSGGDLLLGTTTAAISGGVGLMIADAAGGRIKLCDSDLGVTASDGFELIASNNGTAYIWNRENMPVLFGTNNTERMQIDADGRLLVGATSGTARVHIKGSGGDGIKIENSGGTNAATIDLKNTLSSYVQEYRIAVAGSDGLYGTAKSLFVRDQTSGANRFEVQAGGDVKVSTGNLIIGTSGKGIDFSATANGGANTISELLDDYEEGEWNPAFANGLIASAYESNGQRGQYTKIGNFVHFTAIIHLASASTQNGNVIDISGLPFTSGDYSNLGAPAGGMQYFYQDGFYNSNGFTGIVVDTNTIIRLYRADTGAYLTGTSVNGGREIRIHGTYATPT